MAAPSENKSVSRTLFPAAVFSAGDCENEQSSGEQNQLHCEADTEQRTNADPNEMQILRSIGRRSVAPRKSSPSCCSFGSLFCCLMVLGGIAAIIYFYVVVLEGDVNNLPITLDGVFDEDPSDAVGPEDSNRWKNSGQGVNLQVVNALGSGWQEYFEESIANWDNGYPDALDLSVTQSPAPDSVCEHEQGVVVVCNGNYGRTPWKGRAEMISTQDGTIIAATARVNEFYLRPPKTNDMRYAMCHELGHAWGLHHTDESFTNADLGNCMDYTLRPENNMTPDFSNFAFLHALYGLVPGAAPYNPPTSAPTTSPTPAPTTVAPTESPVAHGSFQTDSPATSQTSGGNGQVGDDDDDNKEQDKKDKKNKNNKLRRLAGNTNEIEAIEQAGKLPEWLLAAVRAARKKESHRHNEVVALPRGFLLRIHQLPAAQDIN